MIAEKIILDFTQDDIDGFVRSATPIWVLDGSYHRSDLEFPEIVGDWGLRLINTQGTGNQGVVVATPRSGRTRRIFREGKQVELERVFGDRFAPAVITAYIAESRGVSYVWEYPVIEFVLSHLESFTVEDLYRVREARSTRAAVEDLLGHRVSLSHWRLVSALEMIARINGYSL